MLKWVELVVGGRPIRGHRALNKYIESFEDSRAPFRYVHSVFEILYVLF